MIVDRIAEAIKHYNTYHHPAATHVYVGHQEVAALIDLKDEKFYNHLEVPERVAGLLLFRTPQATELRVGGPPAMLPSPVKA